jgi:hypothetical protein
VRERAHECVCVSVCGVGAVTCEWSGCRKCVWSGCGYAHSSDEDLGAPATVSGSAWLLCVGGGGGRGGLIRSEGGVRAGGGGFVYKIYEEICPGYILD